jgi:uncharacterized protein
MSNPIDDLSRRGFLAGAAAVGTPAPAPSISHEQRPRAGIVILIDRNDPHVMGHAISYAANLSKYFAGNGPPMRIEVVANGQGIDVFRADRTPLTEPLTTLRQIFPNVAYSMCASSKSIAEAKENITIPLIDGAHLVPFGIGRVAELQMKGWAYIHG